MEIKIVNLNETTSYGELKNMLPSTGEGRVPGIKQLLKSAIVIYRKETGTGIIEIFDNGFFTYTGIGNPTVWGVDRCDWSDLYHEGVRAHGKRKEDFDSYPWEIVLESAGAIRLDHNSDSREESHSTISLDAPESANNLSFCVMPESVIQEEREKEEEYRSQRNRKIAEEYAALRDDQRAIIELYFIEKRRQEDIAEILGIGQSSVARRIATIRKRFEKFL